MIMNEKTRARMTPVVLVCLLFIGVAAWASVFIPSEPAAVAQPKEQTGTCQLGEWEGQVALFEKDADRPIEVYEITVRTLPEEEQERLRERILVNNDAELEKLLENYGS